jgi:hypothetical protein
MKKLQYYKTIINTKFLKILCFFLYSVQYMQCGVRRKFEADCSIFKLSKVGK